MSNTAELSPAARYQLLIDGDLINDPEDISSSQYLTNLEASLPPDFNMAANRRDHGQEVEMKVTIVQPTASTSSRGETSGGQAADHSSYHEPLDNFHYRDFVFALPAPYSADTSIGPLPAYDHLTSEQELGLQQRSNRNPLFDLRNPPTEEPADIKGHMNDSRYFRHLDFFKSQIGAEKIYTNVGFHQKQGRNRIRPGQIKLNNAYGLYEVEHWPNAQNQVIWTNWVICAAQAEKHNLLMPAVPKEAKTMFQLAVLDGSRYGWKECWMMTPGSRLFCAICRTFKLYAVARRPVRRSMELGDRDHTEWTEVEWRMGTHRQPAVKFGGHDFSRTRAMRDTMVVKRGIQHGRKPFKLPLHLGGHGTQMLRSANGELVPLGFALAIPPPPPAPVVPTAVPAAPAAPAMPLIPREAGNRDSIDSLFSSRSRTSGSFNRQSMPYQPAHASGLRHSTIATNSDSLSTDVQDEARVHPSEFVGHPKSTAPQIESRQTSGSGSQPSTALTGINIQGVVKQQTVSGRKDIPQNPPPSPPVSIVIQPTQSAARANRVRPSPGVRNDISSQRLPVSGRHAAPVGQQNIPPQAFPRPQTVQQPDMAPRQPSSGAASNPANPTSGITQVPSTLPMRAERISVEYHRPLPSIAPEQIRTELNAMQHNQYDEVRTRRTIRKISRHIALGLWSLPAWNNSSEAQVNVKAGEILAQQLLGLLKDWRQNVIGPNYTKIHQTLEQPSLCLLGYMTTTLRQANPVPLSASEELGQLWRAAHELEARRWRMEMINSWGQLFSMQRQQAFQTPGNHRYKQVGEGLAIDLVTGKIILGGQ